MNSSIEWDKVNTVLILQPENPDGDSVASALALEEIFGDLGKQVIIYSYVQVPGYLNYISGADRIVADFPATFDITIIVDTVNLSLLEKTLVGGKLTAVKNKPVLVLDHHPVQSDLPLPQAEYFSEPGQPVSTGEIVYFLAEQNGWTINKTAATHIVESMLADTLGLSTEVVQGDTLRVVAKMLDLGANLAEIDARRRKFLQKTPEVINYKGKLLQTIEYACDGQLALVHIPWPDIQQISPHYNPSVLALEELRNAEGVLISVALKTYPDGKITAKIRSNNTDDRPLAGDLAAAFGGGGHAHAAGFKTHDWHYSDLKTEVIKQTTDLLNNSTK